jgi:uncharacterized protein (DUF2384 family)
MEPTMTEEAVPDLSDLGPTAEEQVPDLSDLGPASDSSAPSVSFVDQAAALEAKKTFAERASEIIPEEVTAGLEAYGRSALPIAYQAFERVVGVPREEQERRAAESPLAAALGTVGGIGAGVLMGTGAAQGLLGAKAATALAPAAALTRRVGEGYRVGVQALLPGATTTVLGKTATGALTGAAEAAILGTALEADEAMLKDRAMSAEAVFHSTILGGKVGGLLSALPATAAAVGQTGAGRWLAKTLGETQFGRVANNLGLTAKQIETSRRQIGPDGLPSIMNDAVKYRIISPTMSAQKAVERSKDMMDRSGEVIGRFTREADERMTQELAPKWDDISEKISDKVISKYADVDQTKNVAERISRYLDFNRQKFESGVKLSDLHQLRKDIYSEIFGPLGERVPADSSMGKAWNAVSRILTKEISEGLERAGIESQAWRIPQRQYQVASTINRFANKAVAAEQAAKPADAFSLLATGAGYALKGIFGAAIGAVTKRVPGALADTGGWIAGALKNALESGAPKAVVDDLQSFANMREVELASQIPGPAIPSATAARTETQRLMFVADNAKRLAQQVPNVRKEYVDALDNAYAILSNSYSPNMSPAFAAQRIKQAEDILTPFSRLAEGRASFQDPVAQLVRTARDEMRGSLAQSDAWGQAYRDAAAQRLVESAAKMVDPRRVAALQSLEQMTNDLETRISTLSDQLMGVAGDTTKQLIVQKRQQNQVKRGLNNYVRAFEPEEIE